MVKPCRFTSAMAPPNPYLHWTSVLRVQLVKCAKDKSALIAGDLPNGGGIGVPTATRPGGSLRDDESGVVSAIGRTATHDTSTSSTASEVRKSAAGGFGWSGTNGDDQGSQSAACGVGVGFPSSASNCFMTALRMYSLILTPSSAAATRIRCLTSGSTFAPIDSPSVSDTVNATTLQQITPMLVWICIRWQLQKLTFIESKILTTGGA